MKVCASCRKYRSNLRPSYCSRCKGNPRNKKFERPYTGMTGWEVTLFGYQIFRFNDKTFLARKDMKLSGRWKVRKVA